MEQIPPGILHRYADRQLPRYTSYPTAPHFTAEVQADQYRRWLGELTGDDAVSIYLHVPFCCSMCWYCGCNTSVTRRNEPILRYVDALIREIDMVADAIRVPATAKCIHFGGGTPTLLPAEQFARIMRLLNQRFGLAEGGEIAVEIDPRSLQPGIVSAMAAAGVNRASLGVQSFDPVVQKAINRVQSYEQVWEAVAMLRGAGIGGLNFDLIYGLPRQDLKSCLHTVECALTLRPDRLSVFGYAHVPGFKAHQRKIDEAALPCGDERHEQASAIAELLCASGYVQVGLDHFALRGDALAAAAREDRLHRNFQGYTTDSCDTLLAFGASSIGELPQGYVQNAARIGDYLRLIDSGLLAAVKGRGFAGEDRLRAAIIERIMCNHQVDLEAECSRFGADAAELQAQVASRLEPLISDGVAKREGSVLRMPGNARPLVRLLAAAFDEYLGQGQARHSRAV